MNCEICNKKIIIFKKLESFNLLKCYNCDHIISNIKTSKKYYQTTYSDIYVSKKHKNWMNNPNNALFEIIYLFIKSKRKGKILDLGCGTGLLLKYLKKKSKFDLTGVDIMAKTDNSSKICFIKKELLKFVPKNVFSFVISIMVIEHVPKLKLFVNHLKKITKTGAYCIIVTINTDSLLYKIAHFLYNLNFKDPFVRLYDPHHLNHFSNKSLESLFVKNGFNLEKRINTPISMKQVDYPYSNLFMKYFLYFNIYFIMHIGSIFSKSWIQTVIFKKKI